MVLIRTSELRELLVIDLEAGRYLGNVCDVDVHAESGTLCSLVLERPRRSFLWFHPMSEVEINWQDVVLVGTDVVLVRLSKEIE